MQELITSLGLPVALLIIVLGYYAKKDAQNREDNLEKDKIQREDNKLRDERMYQQLDKFDDTLNLLNSTMNDIRTELSDLKNKVEGHINE